MPVIYVDADACPVKNEVYRVAERHGLHVKIVANSPMGVPTAPWVELIVVGDGFDAADDWIVENVCGNDIVVSDDIPLAARCVKKAARVLTPKGRIFTEASIGEAMATRDLLSDLRAQGLVAGGPAPFRPKDRSLFLQRLDQIVRDSLRPT